ncbi:hypothetical protein J6590_098000 [Homalodisca vitripennis]|nr:hypothetical protein J6590_098000 [Homalodisca vitripennis]
MMPNTVTPNEPMFTKDLPRKPTQNKTKLNRNGCSAFCNHIPRILVKDNTIKVSADYRTASELTRLCILNEGY